MSDQNHAFVLSPNQLNFDADLVLDEFDRRLAAGESLSLKKLLTEFGFRTDNGHENQQLISSLIEIEICYQLERTMKRASTTKGLGSTEQQYQWLGDWAVKHAADRRVALEHSFHAAQSSNRKSQILATPVISDRFEIDQQLGAGGMGTVYRVTNRSTGQELALKTLRVACPSLLHRLKSEFRSVASIPAHPAIIRLHEMFVLDAEAAFTMDLIRGSSLYHAFTQSRRSRQVGQMERSLCLQLVQGLSHVHAHGWLHCDLKPTNVMVNETGNRLTLLDFGLARMRDQPYESNKEPINADARGTFHYIAPEQTQGKRQTAASDWYSLGVALQYCLTGQYAHSQSVDSSGCHITTSAGKLRNKSKCHAFNQLLTLAEDLQAANPLARPTAAEILDRIQQGSFQARSPVSTHSQRHKHNAGTFVGRTEEIRTIVNQLSFPTERPTLIHVFGSSGIGKTALITEAVKRYHDERDDRKDTQLTWIAAARCLHRERVAYPGLDQIVDQIVERLNQSPVLVRELESIPSNDLALLSQIFPSLRCIPQIGIARENLRPDGQQAPTSEHIARAFNCLLQRITHVSPLTIIIDDFQWSNFDTRRLIGHLLSQSCCPRLTIVLSDRDGQFLKTRTNGIHRLELRPLSRKECQRYVAIEQGRFPTPPDSSHLNKHVRNMIAEKSAGNPLHMSELYNYLTTDRSIDGDVRFVVET